MNSQTLLITGGTGFIGSHVLKQAVEAGYSVKATTRPGKADWLRSLYGSKVEVIVINDIASADIGDALAGVHAVLHVAAPLPYRVSNGELIDAVMKGTTHILKQAQKAGVSRFILTSSYASIVNFEDNDAVFKDYVYSEKDWNPCNIEEALNGERNNVYAYMAAKVAAEKEVFTFAAEHPEIDITIMNPPFVYGPLIPGFQSKKGDLVSMATVGFFVQLVLSSVKLEGSPLPFAPHTIDVRDIAKAHLLAISAPSSAELQKQKRLILAAQNWSWGDAVEYLSESRPEIKSRLSDVSKFENRKATTLNSTFAEEVLGFKEYIDWRKTIDDMVDSVLAIEKSWASQT